MLLDRPFYHEGMREFQDRFDGRRVADAIDSRRKHSEFWDEEIEMIQAARFFFLATAWGDYVDCTIKSGDPGFIKITGPGQLEYPEYDGNSMYRTVGNIQKNPNVGLLFVVFDGKSRRIRVNGRATVHYDPETLARHFGAMLVVRIECEIYPNCPRYIPNLSQAKEESPYVPREGRGLPPAPEWKSRDIYRDNLPADDPHRQQVQSASNDKQDKQDKPE
jgi:predicted pyridoxine 5'-phosphate oxidase superfamily flavin-nucleotide-binding protein